MRTRNQSKLEPQKPSVSGDHEAGTSSVGKSKRGKGILVDDKKPGEDVSIKSRNAKRKKGIEKSASESEEKQAGKSLNDERKFAEKNNSDFSLEECNASYVKISMDVNGEGVKNDADINELDWEDGDVSVLEERRYYSHELGKEVTVEFTDSPSAQQKTSRRYSAEDKELAELVHRVHILCLLARGRIIDSACNDPTIQASLLSLLPSNLIKVGETQNLTANELRPLVNWFSSSFRVRNQNSDKGSSVSNLACALQSSEGTAEEIAALSVVLFRALNLATRFVCILDVVSLKPDADVPGSSKPSACDLDTKVSCSPTVKAADSQVDFQSSVSATKITNDSESFQGDHCFVEEASAVTKKVLIKKLANNGSFTSDDKLEASAVKLAKGSKRKGDLEFELEMEMALSATSATVQDNKSLESPRISASITPQKKLRQTKHGESSLSTHGSPGAVWSRRTGPPLYWAEVFCSGETLTGRWVHVDATNAIVDGSEKVEAAAAACRRPLKYAIAFAGNGAKDVTRRYCTQWHKVAPKRVNPQWLEAVLAPLNELEAAATASITPGGKIQEEPPNMVKKPTSAVEMELKNSTTDFSDGYLRISSMTDVASRSYLEDIELATRALTEPLPTNQLAYRNHHLYAIEKWLTKNQILHPKGPVLGYCSGHPVYPRSCVQTLRTKFKWLQEGLQVRSGEIAAKIVPRVKQPVSTSELDILDKDYHEPTLELYGKWQLEPLRLPHAENGIVPKNERGQVDVWSEKCLPPGTVHLRLPRLVPVAKRLGIDFAPAMVGFEFRSGRSYPIFEGIVVCEEFKGAILEAHAEEEERRESEEKKRNETQALSRWFQLLSSITTRHRLLNCYANSSPVLTSTGISSNDNKMGDILAYDKNSSKSNLVSGHQKDNKKFAEYLHPCDHGHVYPIKDQSFDEERSIRIKRCPCGFSIEIEEL